MVLHHVGLIDEALAEVERALAVSPDHSVARYVIGHFREAQGRWEEALQITESVAREVPSSWVHYQLAGCQLRLGRVDEARATVQLMERQLPGDMLTYPLVGLMAAMRGDAAEARKQIRLISAARKDLNYYHHAQYDAACILALLGSTSESICWLAEAAHNGYPCHPFFEADPWLASLRGDEQYQRLMKELREECDRYARLYRELRAADPTKLATWSAERTAPPRNHDLT